MEDSKVLYYIDKGIEKPQENSRFPPESIIDNDRFYLLMLLQIMIIDCSNVG